ncbi:MAG: COX15/CtaA family protein [Betaproteobacteria bacterium]|jgi:heme A synthase|nr:COX15/CtaA family protein [Betaproteobacteria bacterium]
MTTRDERLQRIRILALLLTALSLLVVAISAYLRLSGAGLGCAAWPDCYGQLLSGAQSSPAGLVRISHRLAASLALLLGFALAWHCIRPDPIRPLAGHATLLVALMILLTFIGLWSSDPHRVWTGFLNMLGGLGLVALSWRIAVAADPLLPPQSSRSALPLQAGIAALVMTVALGALIGARYAAATCGTTPACAGVWWPAAGGLAALNPFAVVASPGAPGDAGGVALHLFHRYCAVAALLLLGLGALRALAADATRTAGGWLLALLAMELVLGSLTVVSGFSLWLAIGHSVGAAVLFAVALQVLDAGVQATRRP